MPNMEEMEISDASDAVQTIQTERRRGRKLSLLIVLAMVALVAVWIRGVLQEEPTCEARHYPLDSNATSPPTDKTGPVCQTITSVDSCSDSFDQCQTDRLSHSTPLCAGQALCNDAWRMEVTLDGSFQWRDCNANETLVFYESEGENENHNYFELTSEGVLQVKDQNTVLWQKESTEVVCPTERCLKDPVHNCPYIHLRARGGSMVLNWKSGGPKASNFKHIYEDLIPH